MYKNLWTCIGNEQLLKRNYQNFVSSRFKPLPTLAFYLWFDIRAFASVHISLSHRPMLFFLPTMAPIALLYCICLSYVVAIKWPSSLFSWNVFEYILKFCCSDSIICLSYLQHRFPIFRFKILSWPSRSGSRTVKYPVVDSLQRKVPVNTVYL